MTAIKHLFTINNASSEDVYRAINRPEKWWTTATSKEGEEYSFRFSRDYQKKFIVEEDQPNRIQWKCVHAAPDWIDTKVIFELLPDGENVKVRFIHDNWQEENDNYAICSYHWAGYMDSIKSLVENGKGKPTEPKL